MVYTQFDNLFVCIGIVEKKVGIMIPKVIHYCWFGKNPMPEDIKHYISSWKHYCPDYKIIEWNESNFEISSNQYTKEAYENKKWAFVTDYVRLFALYYYGGIYMDTDVEVIRPLDIFLTEKAFSGFELPNRVPTGLMASEKSHPFIKELLDEYSNKCFIGKNGVLDLTTNVELITFAAQKKGLNLNNQIQTVADFTFYPTDYFCPKNNRTLEVEITPNTYTIHHFKGTWQNKPGKLKNVLKQNIGPNGMKILIKIKDWLDKK